MPKARTYKKSNGQRNLRRTQTITTSQSAATLSSEITGTAVTTPSRSRTRPQTSHLATTQGLTMSLMVALGSWGMAIFFVVFSTDPNHILFAGMACLMALMWSFSFFVRLRKVLR